MKGSTGVTVTLAGPCETIGLRGAFAASEASDLRWPVWLLAGLAAFATACGLPQSASPAHPARASMSARFLTNPLSAGGGAPMAVAPVSGKIGFVLSRSNPNRVAGGLLLKTTDGGERFINLPLPSDLVYEGLYARSATNVVIWAETPACLGVGQGCTAEVLQSRDGGRTVSVALAVKGLIWVASTHYGSSGLWLAATTANCYGT